MAFPSTGASLEARIPELHGRDCGLRRTKPSAFSAMMAAMKQAPLPSYTEGRLRIRAANRVILYQRWYSVSASWVRRGALK